VGFVLGKQGCFHTHKSINAVLHINRIKEQNHMIISINVEKLDQIQHTFMMKILKELDIERRYLNSIKSMHDKTTGDIYAE
jgi:hypothetical protein